MYQDFFGNKSVVETLERAILQKRIPQTILLAGPAGVGKATLARRFAAQLLGGRDKIEADDLSLHANAALVAERQTWTSEKRVEEPLLFSTHPDFLTFPPDGPLRQISIQQMRLLKERAQFKALSGAWRVFLIDHLDRANEQAANSLLKTLEEPPAHLVLILTAENAYDLLPTIRSRAVLFSMAPLDAAEMAAVLESRHPDNVQRRISLSAGSPGIALSIDLESYDNRRAAMFALLEVGAGRSPFVEWAQHSERISASRQEKLEGYLSVLYLLLEDLLLLQQDVKSIRNIDLRRPLETLLPAVSFDWILRAVRKVDKLVELLPRNIQKNAALDALAVELRAAI